MNIKVHKRLQFIILFFLFAKCSFAQLPDFHPVILDESNGLSSNQVNCFFQDRNGYMWIGTDNGLNRYDGYSFDVFRKIPGDTTSIAGNIVSCITEDKDHFLWVGHGTEGLSCFNPATGRFTSYKHDDGDPSGLLSNIISATFVDSKNNVWVATGQHGLSLLDRKSNSFIHFGQLPDIDPAYTPEMQKNYNSVYNIYEDDKGLFWLATHNGLYTFDTGKKQFTSVRKSPIVTYQWRDDLFGAMIAGKDGSLWMGSWGGGLTYYNRLTGKWKNFKYDQENPQSPTKNIVFGVSFKSNEELWLATSDRGLGIFNTKEEKFYFIAKTDELKNDPAIYLDAYTDREGNAWFSHDKGISFIYSDATLFSRIDLPVSTTKNGKFYGINCIYKDTTNHLLFVGTAFADGLYVINERTGSRKRFSFAVKEGEESALLTSFIMKDSRGTIWVSTRDVMYQYEIKKEKLVDIPQPPVDTSYHRTPYFYRMLEDKDHMLWIITLRYGVYKLDPATFSYTHYDHSDKDTASLCSRYINCIAEDAQHNLWFGSGRNGVSCFIKSKGVFENFTWQKNNPSSLANDVVTDMTNDIYGNTWIGTYGGLSKVVFDKDKIKFSNITSFNGLASESIVETIGDKNGNVWFTSSAGLGVLNVSDNKIRYYTNKDGLMNEYNLLTLFDSDDGEIFMGIYGGYFRFYPSSIKRTGKIPAITIKSFKVFDKEKNLQPDRPISLSYTDNFFSFDFTSINFTDPEKTRYAYMLQGFDKGWIYCGSRQYASYTNLDGGDYVFKVKAQNANGEWGKETAISMNVEPPFWKEAWFIITVSLLATLIISAIYFIRIRSIRKTEKLKTEFNKKIAEVEMRALRAQMNPHFIFNCLNSINRYIVKSDTKTASLYLTKFSKLIRLILDNSENKNVILSSEIESLKLYIEMESIRFENKFSFEINVNDDVNTESISVPPLIIQPYVENAIWHGLLNKETAGKLSVAVSRHNSTLQCIVEDDGVGRAKAKELKSKSTTTRKSLGIKLTEDRLAMLNENAEEKSSVEIIDLKNEQGNDCGTKVTIKIPVIEN